MEKALITTSLLAYLSCAAPQQTNIAPVPIIEVKKERTTAVEETEQKEEHPAKIASDFIVQTLEEKIKKYPGASSAFGNIHFEASHLYTITYSFDRTAVCRVGTDETLPKEVLFMHFMDYDHHGKYEDVGNGKVNSIGFNTMQPFYPATMVSFLHGDMNPKKPIKEERSYSASSEAQKFYEQLLMYTAEKLKQGPLTIKFEDYYERISIQIPDQKMKSEEWNLLEIYSELINALPTQRSYFAEEKSNPLYYSCKHHGED